MGKPLTRAFLLENGFKPSLTDAWELTLAYSKTHFLKCDDYGDEEFGRWRIWTNHALPCGPIPGPLEPRTEEAFQHLMAILEEQP